MGASAIPVARSIRRWGGTLYCVDTWAGDVHDPDPGRLWAPWMLVSCARSLMDAGVGGNVRLIPATTRAAAEWWRQPIDYLYIDAAHDYASVRADPRAGPAAPGRRRGGA